MRGGGESGSVLVEALVASAMVALVLAFAYRAMGEGALRARAAEEARLATLVAQSRLAAVGRDIPLEPGETKGLEGGFQWRVEVSPVADGSGGASGAGQLYAVTAAVQARQGDRVALRSLRLGPAA